MAINSVVYIPLILISILALWKENHVLFMVAAGVAMITGLYTTEIMGTGFMQFGISIGLIYAALSFLCIAWAVRLMFWRDTSES